MEKKKKKSGGPHCWIYKMKFPYPLWVALIETGPIKSSLDLEDKIPYSSWMALFEMSPIKSLHRVTGIFLEVAPQLDLQDERVKVVPGGS